MEPTDQQKVMMMTMWKDGVSFEKIGEAIGVSTSTAYIAMLRMGISEKRQPVSFWTPERIAYLVENAPHKTGGQMAKELGCSRNAVIGKAHREGIQLSGNPPMKSDMNGKNQKRKRALQPRVKVAPRWQKRMEAITRVDTEIRGIANDTNRIGIGIMQLTSETCRAVLDTKDERGLATYCGYPTENGGKFCPAHAAIYYLPPDGRRRA